MFGSRYDLSVFGWIEFVGLSSGFFTFDGGGEVTVCALVYDEESREGTFEDDPPDNCALMLWLWLPVRCLGTPVCGGDVGPGVPFGPGRSELLAMPRSRSKSFEGGGDPTWLTLAPGRVVGTDGKIGSVVSGSDGKPLTENCPN